MAATPTPERTPARRITRLLFPFGLGNIGRLSLAYFFSTLYFYAPVGTLYLQGRGLSLLQINSIWSLIVATMFLAEIPTGILADRIGHKWAVVLALALQTLGEVVYLFARSYTVFVIDAVIAGLGFAFGSGCVEGLVGSELRAQGQSGRLSEALGTIDAAQRLANLLAYGLGGLLLAQLTPERFRLAIALTAGGVALGCAVTLALKTPPRAESESHRSSLDLLRDGIDLLRGDCVFRRLLLLWLATTPFLNYLGSLYQPHFVQAEVGARLFGPALAVASGLSMLASRYAYKLEEWLGWRAALWLVTLLPGLFYLLLAPILGPTYALILFCLCYGSMGLRGPLLNAHLNRRIDDGNRATVMSLVSMFSGLYIALWGPIIGWLGDVSTTLAFFVSGGIVLLGGALFGVRRVGSEGD